MICVVFVGIDGCKVIILIWLAEVSKVFFIVFVGYDMADGLVPEVSDIPTSQVLIGQSQISLLLFQPVWSHMQKCHRSGNLIDRMMMWFSI